ncbi:DUF58 domain-containing protein [Thermoanaerobacterium saccharolyticum]|uniref:DUF58 domain-containing protein n=2 Tax=Thermoanaerobacterium TaxID=28895 RepID=W9E8M5_9THEO|nr:MULTISPECIES: DUF58 domain-containing protein [Thermoanaerobacterium]AFK86073.1 protein of unknown function DUF58 [Thermoanaerobacterium saccharolyticum JW/SL-YS485]ETO37165.1 hypothetical protein V518_2677 [Thermoanaerobacterium aotearoense SCUT27]
MRNFILLLSFTIVSFLFAVFTGGEILYYIFFADVVLLLLNFLYAAIGILSLSIEIDTESTEIHVDDKIKYSIKVKNKLFLPLAFVSIDENNKNFFPITTNLNPFQKKVIKRNVLFKKRGIYTVGPIVVKIKDPFSIFQIKMTVNRKYNIVVYPKAYDVAFDLPLASEVGGFASHAKQFEDYTNLANLREYVDGDSLKKVHWRISAKLQRLYVKEYQHTALSEIVVLWDLCKNHYKADDGTIDEMTAECVLSLVKYCLTNGLPVRLVDYETNRPLAQCSRVNDFSIIKFWTLKLFPIYEMDFGRKLFEYVSCVPKDSTIAIITPSIDETLLAVLSQININQNIVVFYTNKDKLDEKTENGLENLGIKLISWRDMYEGVHMEVQYN